MQNLSIILFQSDLFWEDPGKNLEMFSEKIEADWPKAPLNNGVGENTRVEGAPHPDIIILPEMFTTGFTQEPARLAEPMEGRSMKWMLDRAVERSSVVTGSIIIQEDGNFHNRLIWMPPDGNYSYYDKRHLFTYAGEHKRFTAGSKKLIVEHRGWKIMPLICYDLRFPVWNRNTWSEDEGFAYDCMINVANWPAARSHVWRVLLMARAIENQAYVIGINRTGRDNNDIDYLGDSAVISPKGENISSLMPQEETSEVVTLTRCELDSFRDKFRVWADWDNFSLK